jgi:hypothetical protein
MGFDVIDNKRALEMYLVDPTSIWLRVRGNTESIPQQSGTLYAREFREASPYEFLVKHEPLTVQAETHIYEIPTPGGPVYKLSAPIDKLVNKFKVGDKVRITIEEIE